MLVQKNTNYINKLCVYIFLIYNCSAKPLRAHLKAASKRGFVQALTEEGTVLDGSPISVAVESRAETAVLVGVPYEAGTEYVRLLFTQCGEVAHIHEFSKTKYKIRECTVFGTFFHVLSV